MDTKNATALEGGLRLLTCLTTAIALPLNITATIISMNHQRSRWARRGVTTFCFIFIPLALTVFIASITLQYMKKHSKTPRALYFKALDFAAACAYFAVLVPCWALEIREFNAVGFGLLTGYVTAPLIVNMFIHMYFTLNGVPWTKFARYCRKPTCQQCPNCQATFTTGSAPAMTSKGYSLLRGEDYLDVEAGPMEYRDSEDFLGEGAERAETAEHVEQPEQARAAEESDKGKDML